MNTKILLIGGIVFNHMPISFIWELFQSPGMVEFIDINQFTAPFDLNSIIEQIKEHLLMDGQNVVIGYSCGGLIAINLLQHYPQLIKQIILLNSTPKFIADENWQGIKSHDLENLRQKLDQYTLNNFRHYFTRLCNYPDVIDIKEYVNYYSATTKVTLAAWLEIIATTDLRDVLRNSVTYSKVKIINSAQDNLVKYNLLTCSCYLLEGNHFILDQWAVSKYIINLVQ